MKANVSISNIYWNKSLSGFFFREQAMKTFEEFVGRSSLSGSETLDVLDELTEDKDIDDIDEMFYNDPIEEIAEYFGFELDDNDEEE